ncbi:MAG: hypothetical protein ACYTHJ_14645 [Planctomycetota bacterium]|jgi:hypothetical protein
MRNFGLALFYAGFLAAAFIAVRNLHDPAQPWQSVQWSWYVLAFVIGTVGVIIMRATAKSESVQAHRVDADMNALGQSLTTIVGKLETLNRDYDTTNVYDVHLWIDDQLAEELGTFVDARESISLRYGLQQYADIMSKFALGERNINRAWSASADGYIDEVRNCISRALALFQETHEKFQKLENHQ